MPVIGCSGQSYKRMLFYCYHRKSLGDLVALPGEAKYSPPLDLIFQGGCAPAKGGDGGILSSVVPTINPVGVLTMVLNGWEGWPTNPGIPPCYQTYYDN